MSRAKRVPHLTRDGARHLSDQKIIAQLRRENSVMRNTIAGAYALGLALVHDLAAIDGIARDVAMRITSKRNPR